MGKTELSRLSHTVNTTIQKLGKLQSSLEALRALTTCTDVSDIKVLTQIETMLTQIETINSALGEFKLTKDVLANHLNACERQFSRIIQIGSSETLTNDAIYALYCFAKRNEGAYIRTNPDTEIADAINYISSLTSREWKRGNIELKDGLILQDRQLAVPKNLPEDAISADNVAQFCIGMNLAGKRLSFTLLRHLIANQCVNILEYIVKNKKDLNKTISLNNLFLTVLIEWPSHGVKSPLQVFAAIEATYPGTIKSAKDANGNNALWFALPLFYDSPYIALKFGEYFAACGCDLAKSFSAGFSWYTMFRLMSIIKRHEQD